MSDHGILQPNPALLHEVEERRKLKSKPVIAHDLGAGAPCTQCGPKCPGFQLHFWRKHCSNCRCGKADHNVYLDQNSTDVGFYFVGKIFDRPLRSRQEVLKFCYGNSLDDDDDGIDETAASKPVKFDWIPHNVSDNLAKRYLKELPASKVPIVGTEAAKDRQQRLEKQFPIHDIEPEQCDVLPPEELKSMLEYIGHVKKDVAGLATIMELEESPPDLSDLPPPPPELLDPPNEEPIYANLPLKRPSPDLFHAKPYYSGDDDQSDPSVRPKSCQHCQTEMQLGDVAIRADRAGIDKVWHPQCFKCFQCNVSLEVIPVSNMSIEYGFRFRIFWSICYTIINPEEFTVREITPLF